MQVRNYYHCAECGREWTDVWSAQCDDDCPHCGARHMSPHTSDDLTIIVVPNESGFAVFCSADTAEHNPDYRELKSFGTRSEAQNFADDFVAPEQD